MDIKYQKKHDDAIDILRLIAILGVVLIHTTTRTLELANYDLNNHLPTLFLNQASRFAVPIFFLISGFVLQLNYKEGIYFKFLEKRLSKILIPYLFWTLIYYFLIYKNNSDSLIKTFLNGSASYQLYFIPSLAIFYVLFPLIQFGLKYVNTNIKQLILIIILFVLETFILDSDYQFHKSILPYPVAVVVFNFFIFIFGMILAKNRKKIIEITNKYFFIFILFAMIFSYIIFSEGKNDYYQTYNYLAFYSQWRVSVLIYSIAIFGSLYYFARQFNFNILRSLSKNSLNIFFIHVIFLEALTKYLYTNDLIFFTAVVTVSLFASLGQTYLLKYLKRLYYLR